MKIHSHFTVLYRNLKLQLSHLGPSLFFMTIIELNPNSPVVSEHRQVVPGVQGDLGAGPDQAWPRPTVQSTTW